jgi:hypothetical protein
MSKKPADKEWLTNEQLVERLESLRNGRSFRTFVLDFPGVHYQGLYLILKNRRMQGVDVPRILGYEPVTVYKPIVAAPPQSKKVGRR